MARYRRTQRRRASRQPSSEIKRYDTIAGTVGLFITGAYNPNTTGLDSELPVGGIGTWNEMCTTFCAVPPTTDLYTQNGDRTLFPFGWRQFPTLVGGIVKGTAYNQRTGDRIWVKDIEIRGSVHGLPQDLITDYQTFNATRGVSKMQDAPTSLFRMLVFVMKKNFQSIRQTDTAGPNWAQTIADNVNLFTNQQGNGVNSPFYPAVKSNIQILHDSTFSLGANGTSSQAPEYPFHLKIPIRKVVIYNSGPTGTIVPEPPSHNDIYMVIFSDRSRQPVSGDTYNWQGPNPYGWKAMIRTTYTDV